jgi:crotonobetainyl-CoA:carnitine CoA-transferase CaiB-like acyl-CoA transferase
MGAPLEHIRVVDFGRALSGPLAAQILADLGADVIKVERPGTGDEVRTWGPPFLAKNESAYYLATNRGKRSIALDLSDPGDRQIALALAERADVLIENFKVGTLTRFGLGYEELKAVNRGLIYCSLTGFGQTGPRRDEVAYDFKVQALAGLMHLTGLPDGEPGGGPMKIGVAIVDMTTGLYGAIAILAALARRAETGAGDHIDVAMLDVALATLISNATAYLISGEEPERTGNAHRSIQPYDVYACSDAHLALVVGNDAQFAKLSEALGLAPDDRFATNALRVENIADLRPLLEERFARESRAFWLERLGALGVPCAPINSVGEALADPQTIARGMRVDLPHPLAGSVPLISSPLNFADASLVIERGPPLLDEHRDEILAELAVESPA